MAIKNIFFLTWSATNSDSTGLACCNVESKLDMHLVPAVIELKQLPFDFEIRKVKVDRSGVNILENYGLVEKAMVDYQPNELAWPLMSEKMKKLVDAFITENDGVGWIETKIALNDQFYPYYVLVFNKSIDTIDEEKTMYVNKENNHIIKPHFSIAKIEQMGINILRKPFTKTYQRINAGVFVTDRLKSELIKNKITGIKFEKIAAS